MLGANREHQCKVGRMHDANRAAERCRIGPESNVLPHESVSESVGQIKVEAVEVVLLERQPQKPEPNSHLAALLLQSCRLMNQCINLFFESEGSAIELAID
jgi:hypothetical protein